jgi:hypothetical protein
VTAVVHPTAAMLLEASFQVEGRTVHPFARAPWIGDSGLEDLPGHLRVLGGEFVGVPFGSSGAPADLDPAWAGLVPVEAPDPPHGASAEEDWTVFETTASSVALGLDLPALGLRLERRIALHPTLPRIDFTLTLTAGTACRVPVGLHPILRLPEEPHTLRLDVAFREGRTYPGVVPPGRARSAPARRFTSLAAVPGTSGSVDLARLPLDEPTEDVLLLTGVSGALRAHYADDRTVVTIDWDRAALPSMLVWISDRALADAPWGERYRGVGLEPLAAAFDLPPTVSIAPNPLSAEGVVTAVALEPGVPRTIGSSIVVSSEMP